LSNENRSQKNDACFFCDKSEELQNHHLVPKFMTKFYPNLKGKGGTIDLCSTCHDKVHYILEPIHLALKHEVELDNQEASGE